MGTHVRLHDVVEPREKGTRKERKKCDGSLRESSREQFGREERDRDRKRD